MGARYEYIDNDLLEQMIEAELIIMLERGNWYTEYLIEMNIRIKQLAGIRHPTNGRDCANIPGCLSGVRQCNFIYILVW